MADFDFTQLKGRMAQAGKGGHVELSDLERNALINNAMDGGGGSVDPEEVQELIDESLEGYYNKFEVDSELNTKSDKADTYTKTEVNNLIPSVSNDIIIGALPASGVANTIYRVPGSGAYTDYAWDGTQFVALGTFTGNGDIDATPTEGSTNPVQSGGVYDGLMYEIYNPLAGMTLGNTSYDPIIGTTLKGIWLEILDQSVTLPTSIKFSLFRNRASSGWFFQMVSTEATSTTILSSSGTPKLTGKNEIVVNGSGTFANKIRVHLSLDFTNDTSDINFGDANTNTTFLVSSMNRGVGLNVSLKDKIDELNGNIEGIDAEIDSINKFSDALKGFAIGDPTFTQYVKSAWVQIKDSSVTIPQVTSMQMKNYESSSVYWIFSGKDANDNYIFSSTRATKLSAGIQEVIVNGYGTTYANVFTLHFIIDVPETLNTTAFANTTLDIDQMNTEETETKTLKDAVSDLYSPWGGHTIVCFGDSNTEFTDDKNMAYPDYIAKFTGANVINVGIGGSQLRQRATPVASPTTSTEAYAALDTYNMIKAAVEQDYSKQVAASEWLDEHDLDRNNAIIARFQAVDWSKVSAITIMGGSNDWNNASTAWGDVDSTDPNYSFGAINEIIRIFLAAYPHIRIYWLTPFVHWYANSVAERTDANWSDNYEKNGKTLKQFSATIEEIVIAKHQPVCDLYNTLGWNQYNFSQFFNDTDGVHARKGYSAIARRVIGFIDANRTF